MAALQGALGLGVAGLEDDPAEAELAAVGGEGLCRAPAAGVDRALAVPDELLGQGAQAGETAAHAPGDVAELLGEDQRPGEGARVGKLGCDHPAPPGLPPADRDPVSYTHLTLP